MRSEKEEELHTIKLGGYALLALVISVLIFYGISLTLKKEEEHGLNCYAIQDIFNDLEKEKERFAKEGMRSTEAKKHNKRLTQAISAAKKSGCFTQNLTRIRHYLMVAE